MVWNLSTHVSLANDRISPDDAARQQSTAAEICRRLNDQPGVILADEVGMGKTFVAFAVAVSVLHATERARPVVVMVPPSVSTKWPSDWSVFQQFCLNGGPEIRASTTSIRRGSEFIKLLDDPPKRRTHLIFLTHGALSTSLNDPFIRLAIVRQAFLYQRDLAPQRAAFPRWARRLLNDSRFKTDLVGRLLDTPVVRWPGEWSRLRDDQLDDDPVPAAVVQALSRVDLTELREALATIPLRSSSSVEKRLRSCRDHLAKAVQEVWRVCLGRLGERLPLLILDEAHHVKNPNLLAGLFDSKEAMQDADVVSENGALAETFDRMLFLTATPFQLGHRELISVLSRFTGTRIGRAEKERLQEDLEGLTGILDSAQAASLRLERAWGRLAEQDLADLPAAWWEMPPEEAKESVRAAGARIREARDELRRSEMALRPWVVRHTKIKHRLYRQGQQVNGADAPSIGLELTGSAIMPFLLAARAQSLVALHGLHEHQATRAYFAEGLASSFEAFAETRLERGSEVDDLPQVAAMDLPADVQWYVDRIKALLPEDDPGSWSEHPKVRATTEVALKLWRDGEKVLIFCFYRATGRALRAHISRAMLADIVREGANLLGLETSDEREVLEALDRRGASMLRDGAPGARAIERRVKAICSGSNLEGGDVERTVEVVTRFMRTASFLVRFVDLRTPRSAEAIDAAFERTDASGATLARRISAFAQMVSRLTDVEREGLWASLTSIQTGSILVSTEGHYDPGEVASRREATLPNVRLANGMVRAETRHRLMRTFNTPFFPEILVASSVMAEGVDLHLDCRHVIHHDLDWNPSTLEQRTGRLDRLGSKAEREGSMIVVYEPYMGGTQDEKMFRVVKDRERWFSVLMGEPSDIGEWDTDRAAERIALPSAILQALTINLSVAS